jgi:L-threonylcarbamoyladenylate synthase
MLLASPPMPRVLPCDPHDPDRASLAEAVKVLRSGGLVAFPTETVYGLGALALDERALARVFVAKGRPTHHPLIVHVENESQARGLASSWPARASLLARAFWPGPLTLVVDRAAHVPPAVAGGTSSIAVRVPAHPVALALLALLGAPVAAPSANRYQGLSPTTAAHVVKQLGDAVDLVLDAGPCHAGIESTVVDVRVDPPAVLRLGAAELASLRAIVPELHVPARDAEPGRLAKRVSPGMDARHYAPRARLVMAPTLEGALAMAQAFAAREERPVGLVVRAQAMGELPGIVLRVLPGEASQYARLLYATLHDLDDANVCAIVVQAVPDDPSWGAVADRLARGSATEH